MTDIEPILRIEDLQLQFGLGASALKALDGVSLSIESGEALCLVGESGSGKSVTALSIARLLPSPPAHYSGGKILLQGNDVLQMSRSALRAVRGGVVSYIFQEPGASMNPVFPVGAQIRESLRLHCPEVATNQEVTRLLALVGIPSPEARARCFPHELSGGMQQRVMLAMAIASRPKLLIADEPTTALDATIQAQIIELLAHLRETLGMAILLITHNLGLASDLADRVAVMYSGQIVEISPTRNLLANPAHPYTRALLQSVPRIGGGNTRLKTIPGSVPQLGHFPPGCRFHPRCQHAVSDCSTSPPRLQAREPDQWVRCPVHFDAAACTPPPCAG